MSYTGIDTAEDICVKVVTERKRSCQGTENVDLAPSSTLHVQRALLCLWGPELLRH